MIHSNCYYYLHYYIHLCNTSCGLVMGRPLQLNRYIIRAYLRFVVGKNSHKPYRIPNIGRHFNSIDLFITYLLQYGSTVFTAMYTPVSQTTMFLYLKLI